MRAIEQQLKTLEATYWEAIQRKDESAAMKLSDSECVVVGAQGVGALDRERLGQMLKQASYDLTRYSFDDKSFLVRKITDDVVVVAYGVREDLVVDGKPESLHAFDASVWVRRDGDWVCTLHTESLQGDPFGRQDLDRLHDPSTASEAKALVTSLIEAHRASDTERVRGLLADDFVWHEVGAPRAMNRQDWIAGMEEGKRAFSEIDIAIEHAFGEGVRVAILLTISMRHTGVFQGQSPTGKSLRFASMWHVRVANGAIAEVWMLDEDFVSQLRER